MKKQILISSAMLFALGSSAYAADAVAELPIASYNWSGAYVGVVGGVNFLKGDVTIPAYTPPDYDGDSTSGSIGGQVCYLYQFPNDFVIGAEARLVAVFNKHRDATGAGVAGDEVFQTKADWQGDIVAKAGYAMGNFLPYIKGGVAFLHLNDTGYSDSTGSILLDHTYTGWTVGFGADYAINDKWFVGIDYAYAHYNSHDFADDSAALGPSIVKPSTHTVSLSLNYRF
jgi:outer membrane immunogenic protein